jgi:hypothetical protein
LRILQSSFPATLAQHDMGTSVKIAMVNDDFDVVLGGGNVVLDGS